MVSPLFQADVAFDSALAGSFQESVGGYRDIPRRQEQRLFRSRRLASLQSVALFPCGSVITSVGPLGAFLTPVVAVVTADEFVIIPAEPEEDIDVEYGRVPRASVTGADVCYGDRSPVPEDVLQSEEELRPDVGGSFVLLVSRGPQDPISLVVRSAIEARRARNRFREWSLS
jgi:hypothetical protein